jgi:hypothetical protein
MSTLEVYTLGAHTLAFVTAGEGSEKKCLNVFLVDGSGSMSSYFTILAEKINELVPKLPGTTKIVVFSNTAILLTEPISQRSFPGSGTNLMSALNELKKMLAICTADIVRVFFVTDGADSNASDFNAAFAEYIHTYKSAHMLEFFLLAVGNGFPVHVSQDLRRTLHTGGQHVPTQFWMQSTADVPEAFRSLEPYLSTRKLSFPHGVYVSPTVPVRVEACTGEYVFGPSDRFEDIHDEDGKPIMCVTAPITWNVFLGAVGQIVSIIQRKAIAANVVEEAKVLEQFIRELYDNFIHTFSMAEQTHKIQTAMDRVMRKDLTTKRYAYEALLKVVTELASGLSYKLMQGLDLANRLDIHTVVTKTSLKALQLRGVDQQDFKKIIDEFCAAITVVKQVTNSSGTPLIDDLHSEVCGITHCSTVDTVREENIIDAIRGCENFVELLDAVAFSGEFVTTKIGQGVAMNPYALPITNVNFGNNITSTTAIREMQEHSDQTPEQKAAGIVSVPFGGGISSGNTVIPLLTAAEAEALGPVMRCKAVQMLMTYECTKQTDICDFNAHLGMIAALFVYWITQPSSSRKTDTLEKVRATFGIYAQRAGIIEFLKILAENPVRAMVTEIQGEKTKCEGMSKVAMMMFVSNIIDQNTFYHMLKEVVGRLIGTQISMKDCFEFKGEPQLYTPPPFDAVYFHAYTIQDTIKLVTENMKKWVQPGQDLEIQLIMEYIEKLYNNGTSAGVTVPWMRQFAEFLGLPEITPEYLFQCVHHALKYTSSADRMSPMATYEEAVRSIKTDFVRKATANAEEAAIREYQTLAKERYIAEYHEMHDSVDILAREEIIVTGQSLGIEVTEENFDTFYSINPNNGLPGNACMCRKCPSFLKPSENFGNHMSLMRKKPGFVEAAHATVFANLDKTVPEVQQQLRAGTHTGTHGRVTFSYPAEVVAAVPVAEMQRAYTLAEI